VVSDVHENKSRVQAFTNDYMVVDSNMHSLGERFVLVVDFQTEALGQIDFARVTGGGSPHERLTETTSRLIERDAGVSLLL
jgi:hypothetical protein